MSYRDLDTLSRCETAATVAYDGAARRSSAAESISLHMSLFKVRILGGVAASALLGAFLVSSEPPPARILFFLLLGTALSYAGAAAWNQVLEIPYDRRMERTKDRPLPSGRLSVQYAAAVGSLLSGVGVIILYLGVTPLTGALSIAAFVSYVFVYTPLKRVGWYGTLVGTLPGAIPAIGGAVYSGHANPAVVVALFVLMVFWQLPHFYAYLWGVKEDYQKAGFVMLPYATPDGLLLMRALVVGGGLLTFISTAVVSYFSPALAPIAGIASTIGAALLFYQSVKFAFFPSDQSSKRLFCSTVYFIAYFTCVTGLSLSQQTF